jgi:hypothetical protein
MATGLRAETLREVLQQNNIPVTGIAPAALEAQVSSGVAGRSGDSSFLAYPSVAPDETLGPPLHVAAYNRSTQKLVYRAIGAQETSDECFGSALAISGQGSYLLVETHINPSASCTLVLDAELRVRNALYGWAVAALGVHEIVAEEDEVHFAPVHPLRLEIVDLETGREQEIYPPDGDPLRQQFSRDLGRYLPPKSWCNEHDHPCDPGSFDEDLRETVAADAAGTKIAFVATYDASGFGDDAERAIGTRSVLYVYRRTESGWNYCQQQLADGTVESMERRLKSDFDQVVQGCSGGREVKVTPVDSPFASSN